MNDLIEDYATFLRAIGRSSSTIATRCAVLRRVNAEVLYGLNGADIPDLVAWLARVDWSIQTRAGYRSHIVEYRRWAVALGHLDHVYDVSAKVARPRVPRGLPRPASENELRLALERLREPWALYVRLAAFAGLRAGEISRLDREHVDASGMWVQGKGGRNRLVPTAPTIWERVCTLPLGPVARARGRRATNDRVSASTSAQLDKLDLAHLTLHSFRHRFATQALFFSKNLRVVQELLGHSKPETTAIYTLVTPGELRDTVIGLPTVD